MPAELIYIQPPVVPDHILKKVQTILRQGGVIIYPTDTVYSIGCLMHLPKSVDTLISVNKISSGKQLLSLICKDLGQVAHYVRPLSKEIFRVLKKYTPGPFAFVLEANGNVHKTLQSKRKEIGIRIPDYFFIQQLIEDMDYPLATSSLKMEGKELEYTTDDIVRQYKHVVDLIILSDTLLYEPSTVLKATGDTWEVIREGKGIDEFIL